MPQFREKGKCITKISHQKRCHTTKCAIIRDVPTQKWIFSNLTWLITIITETPDSRIYYKIVEDSEESRQYFANYKRHLKKDAFVLV